jgi:hypothetical protein
MIASAAARRNSKEVLQQGKKTYTDIKRIIYTQGINLEPRNLFERSLCVEQSRENNSSAFFKPEPTKPPNKKESTNQVSFC